MTARLLSFISRLGDSPGSLRTKTGAIAQTAGIAKIEDAKAHFLHSAFRTPHSKLSGIQIPER